MSEPTIDEMLAWLDRTLAYAELSEDEPKAVAIRAILEQHQRMRNNPLGQDWVISSIRAFVERVVTRLQQRDLHLTAVECRKAMQDELAAMEAEVKE